jgi:hypothetical protein
LNFYAIKTLTGKLPRQPTVIAIAGLLCLAALADPIYGDGWGYYANLESMVDDGDLELGNQTGNYLSDYLYVFQNQIPLKDILAAGLENSYFLPHFGHYPIYFLVLLGLIFLFVIFCTNLNATIMKSNRHDISTS